MVEKSWGRNGQYRREVISLLWLGGLILGCWLAGFELAVPVFVLAYCLTSCNDYFKTLWGRVLFAGLSAASMWFVTWLMIEQVLHLPFEPLIQL